MMKMTIECTSPVATFKLGEVIGKWLSDRNGLIYLFGDIGAGKTAVSKGIVFGYGYVGRVTSPTFTLVNRYDIGRKSIFHMDLYRLSDIDELYEIGFDEMASGHFPVLVEWPEILKDEGFEPLIIIEIERTAYDEKRKFSLSSANSEFMDQIKSFDRDQRLLSE